MRRDCNHIPCKLPECDCKIEPEGLEFVDEVDIPELGNLETVRIMKIEEMTAKGEKRSIVEVAIPKDNALAAGYEFALNTLAGRNKTGKTIGKVKDVLSLFIPHGGKIDRLTDTLKNILFKPKRDNVMNESTFEIIKRFLKQESTRRGVTLVVGLVGALFGYEINPDDLLATATTIVSGGALLYASWKNIKDIFIDDDKPSDSEFNISDDSDANFARRR